MELIMTKKEVKKGYLVKYYDDAEAIAVVAFSAREAKKLGFPELSCEWIDARATCVKFAKVDDLPIGVVYDGLLAVRRGIYTWLKDSKCDACNQIVDCVEHYKGQAVCAECMEKL